MNKKKLQMIEFPSISNTIKKYDNFQNEIIIPAPKKIQIRRIYKVKGFNKSVVAMAIFYIVLLVSVMMMKMWMTYNVSNLGIEKTNIENRLNELNKVCKNKQLKFLMIFYPKKNRVDFVIRFFYIQFR